MYFLIFVVIINVRNVALTPAKIECGYKQCPPTREGALNVHLIPHSHMDAGWVKTFDEYYYGTRSAVSAAHVQLIYHSVLSELMHDTRRKFTFSETAYFWRWWKEQRATTRATFRGLVQAGRVQFAGGGWVQADEATADYLQIIDQLTWGLRKLNDTLGPCGTPKAAWQIDAYGHSREHASLLAQMGYDGLFLGRVDYKERETMMEEDRMEFMWRGSDVLGKMSDIMTHTLFNLYNAPDGFCFDFLCSDEPIANDPDSRVYNAEKRVNDFISQIEKQAKYYDHDNILVTMGGDFTYQSAATWFMNIDKIISYVNSHSANMSDINIFYSTPSCYLKAIYLHGKRDKALHNDKSDQLPYGSDASTYWTGFYTSRPGLKYFARQAHIFLQVVKQLAVISRMADFYELHLLRHATSLILHHDAITGTSQQHVANDFIRILSEAVDACTRKVSQLLSLLTPTWGGSRRAKNSQQFVVCHQLNISQCRFMESQESALLLVYNPLAAKTYHHVRLPAVAMHYSIRDHNDEEVEHQLVPLPTPILNMPGRSGASIQELYFEAENIPPLGYAAYFISSIRDPLEENAYAKKSSQPRLDPEQETIPYISNEYLKVAVDKTTGLLESVQHVDGSKVLISQAFHSYCQPQQTMQSGAYAFRPRDQRPQLIAERAMYYTVRGPLVKEIRQRFNDWVSQIIRLYRGEEFVELEWVVGPVPVGSDLGKEVVSIFKTNVSNNGEFLTDSNARQMMKRSCWNHTASPPTKKSVPACYYPVTSRICIRSLNTSVELCVLTDRAQGGTSYDEGEIELMLHRRLLTEDGFGLEESLNEDSFGVGLIVKGKHRLFFGNRMQEVDEQSFSERASAAARKWALEPRLFLAPGETVSRRKWQNVRNKRYSSLRVHGLPRHIHVLTLEPWKGGSVLLRLENTLEKARTPLRARRNTIENTRAHITVDLRQVFLQMKLRRVRETTLAANQWLEDARQMDWATRYVYNGGDDGILLEDQDYVEAGKPVESEENKEIVNSEEDSVFARAKLPRRRKPNKGMTKPKTARYDSSERRQKRSINITENLIAQHNHSSERHKVNEDSVNIPNVRERYEEIPKNKSIDEQNNQSNESRKLFDVNHNPHSWKANHSSKLNIKSNISKSKVLERRRKLEELRASKRISSDKIKSAKFLLDVRNENESCNNRKRLNKNKKYGYRNSPSNEEHTDYEANLDEEGITKSIYEMYYKARPRKSAFKPHWRDTGETTEHSRRIKKRRFENYDTTESCEHSSEGNRREMNRRRGRAKNVDMPFFMTDRSHVSSRRQRGYRDRDYVRRARESDKDTVVEKDQKSESKSDDQKYGRIIETNEEDAYDDDDDAEEMDDDDSRRRKRATLREEDRHSGSSESDQTHQEYVITLRPTQIRTFVLWFEDKKGYTL